MRVEDLDTPVLIVDLDALEENAARYKKYFDGHGIAFRPHIKTHKTLALAHWQMGQGALGITCQKLGEAEVMVSGGLRTDLLVAYNILGRQKLDRLTALARQTRMTVTADSEQTIRGVSEAARAGGVRVGVLVEIDAVGVRTGVSPRRAVELARLAHDLPGLELRGVMGFPTPPKTRPLFQEALDLFGRAGLPCPVVSGGSTKSAFQAHEVPEFTEYRAGEYLVGGAGHLWEGRHTVAQCALRVIATVVSRPTEGRAILDAGSKTLSATFREGSFGHLVEYPDARFHGASEEHGHVDVSACGRRPRIGERVQVIPVHPCPCVNEHDELVAVRGGRVEAVWPVYARGKVR